MRSGRWLCIFTSQNFCLSHQFLERLHCLLLWVGEKAIQFITPFFFSLTIGLDTGGWNRKRACYAWLPWIPQFLALNLKSSGLELELQCLVGRPYKRKTWEFLSGSHTHTQFCMAMFEASLWVCHRMYVGDRILVKCKPSGHRFFKEQFLLHSQK